jgi:hypothetical protein
MKLTSAVTLLTRNQEVRGLNLGRGTDDPDRVFLQFSSAFTGKRLDGALIWVMTASSHILSKSLFLGSSHSTLQDLRLT